ncbi:MAG: ABC transporter permease [Clostridiales bacterium]|nr:ABC transporter permease [Clostridiales bacterium]
MLEAVKYVFKEHFDNRGLILKMAIVNMNKQTLRTSLGVLWLYLHDFVYFFVFVLFRVLMAGSGQIDGMHNVVYLVTGLIPWFYINEVLNVGSASIKSYRGIIQSIKFPITVIPSIEITAIFFKRMPTYIFIFVVCYIYGYLWDFNIFLFLYYTLCMLMLIYALMLVISAFVAVSSDFQQLFLVTIRVLMYTMPIVWGYKHIVGIPTLNYIIHLNPMVYIINGYRDAFVVGDIPNLIYSAYFWLFVMALFVLGSFVQYKLRRYYSDLM